jgi:hypothetical protein
VFGATLLLAVLAAPPLQADTTVEARRGDRLVVGDFTGSVRISTWERDAIEVITDEADRIAVRRTGSTLSITGSGGRRGRGVDASVRVPSWIDVAVESRSMDVTARGLQGRLVIGNVSGDVRVEGVGGPVEVRSVAGEIVVEDATGGVRASSQSDDVTLRRVSGSVEVHSGDGDIMLYDMRSSSVRAEAQDGDVTFSGSIIAGGDYGFFVHDGDAAIEMPAEAGARVRVSTFDGEFQSDFTVRVERFTSGRQFDFVVGDGAARMEIEVFDGDINLLRRP